MSTKSAQRTVLSTVIAVATALLTPHAGAQPATEWKPTPLEISQLPQYCQGQFNKELAKLPGYTIQGCGGHFNHFCPALVALLRANQVTAPKSSRKYYLGNARSNLEYTRRHQASTCWAEPQLQAAERQVRFLETLLK